MDTSIAGKCHCSAVEWQADLPPKVVLNCHCNMCRQLSGADYSSWVIVDASKFKVVKGSENICTYDATQKFSKSFCTACGTTVSCINNEKFPDHVYVAKGTICSEFDLPVNLQVYTDDKASWVKINEDIPAFNP